MDPADVPAGLEDAILDVVVMDVVARNPAGEPLGDPRAILGMDRLGPEPRLAIERLGRKAPQAFEARAHVEDPFRIQRHDPEDFGNGVSQPAKRLFALRVPILQRLLPALLLPGPASRYQIHPRLGMAGVRCVALIRLPHHWLSLRTIIDRRVSSLLAACLLHLSQDLQLSQQDGLLDRLGCW